MEIPGSYGKLDLMSRYITDVRGALSIPKGKLKKKERKQAAERYASQIVDSLGKVISSSLDNLQETAQAIGLSKEAYSPQLNALAFTCLMKYIGSKGEAVDGSTLDFLGLLLDSDLASEEFWQNQLREIQLNTRSSEMLTERVSSIVACGAAFPELVGHIFNSYFLTFEDRPVKWPPKCGHSDPSQKRKSSSSREYQPSSLLVHS